MLDLPIRNTFIHFFSALPRTRSCSAPPAYSAHASSSRLFPSAAPTKRRLAKRQCRRSNNHIVEEDCAAFREFRSTTIRETWALLAEKVSNKDTQDAKAESGHAPRLRATLPEDLFKDWAYYSFLCKDPAILVELFRTRFVRQNNNKQVEFWCPDKQYFDVHKDSLRNLCANAEKMLESRDKGFFSVVVNSEVVVFLLFGAQVEVDEIARKIRAILGLKGEAVVRHRNRLLPRGGTLGEHGLGAGNQISIDFV